MQQHSQLTVIPFRCIQIHQVEIIDIFSAITFNNLLNSVNLSTIFKYLVFTDYIKTKFFQSAEFLTLLNTRGINKSLIEPESFDIIASFFPLKLNDIDIAFPVSIIRIRNNTLMIIHIGTYMLSMPFSDFHSTVTSDNPKHKLSKRQIILQHSFAKNIINWSGS